MKIFGIIPARKGSKRIKNKNLRVLGDKPLISWTILAGLKSKSISELIVSTDSNKILDVSSEYGITYDGILRNEKYASDKSSTIDTVIYEIKKRDVISRGFSHVMILQPTSPFRTSNDIDSATQLLKEKSAKSIISVSESNHPAEWINTIDTSLSMNMFYESLNFQNNSQSYGISYNLNGAIYLIDIEALVSFKSFILKDKTFAYIMQKEKSIDIDDEFDWKLAEKYISF